LNITKLSSKEISGNTIVQLSPRNKKVENIVLELMGMQIDSVFLFNEKITNYSYNGKLLTIPCKHIVPDDKCCTMVNVYYHGNPIRDASWGGFFFSDTTAYNIGVGMDANPNSYGRIWFPCIDSFEEKATFDFNITVQKGFKAVCSGILDSEKNNSDGTITYFWKMKHEIPTYLASVAVAEYDVIESIYNGINRDIPVSLYMFPEDVANAKVSFLNLPGAMKTYENSYGEYVWDRVGYVEVPFMSGAMEHVCNIAYPEYAVDSTLARETLMAHELSHHWFGNLVTCKTSGDMWLNEGWASYSEALFKEHIYGKPAYKEYVRDNHVKVLSTTHVYDNGYRALFGVPHEYTYGTTVYDKGADVAHTMRGYMQDSIFFEALREYIKEYSFKAASSYDFRDFLSKYSGIDMTDFFDSWIFEKGFPHFSVDKAFFTEEGDVFKTEVTINQNLLARDFYGNNNYIDLTFVDENINLHTHRVNMSGPEETFNFSFPYEIINVFVDLDEKISDATVDNYKIFEDTASYDFPYTDFSILINKLKGKAIVQSTMNHIKVDNIKTEEYEVSNSKYWEIRAAAPEKMQAEGTFYINMTENNLDVDFDEVVLLYRPDNYSEFIPVKTENVLYTDDEGILILKKLLFGQYVAGVVK
jgi:aminopeptidase N